MQILKDQYARWFGKNEAVEYIAEKLRSGTPHLKAYIVDWETLVYFKGTGKYISGTGDQKVFDIQRALFSTWEHSGRSLFEWEPLAAPFKYVLQDPRMLTRLHDQEGEHDPHEVMEKLKSTASRLKPHQYYQFQNYRLTNTFIDPDGVKLHNVLNQEFVVPLEFLGNRDFITVSDMHNAFLPEQVGVFDETKIARHHRRNTDLKRWYTLTEVKNVTDRHSFKFTSKSTAREEVTYYAMDIIIDSKKMAKHPFYVDALVTNALEQLGVKYNPDDYTLSVDLSTIMLTWNDQTVSIDAYRSNQLKYPASVDSSPVLIYPPLVLNTPTRLYSSRDMWTVTSDAKA